MLASLVSVRRATAYGLSFVCGLVGFVLLTADPSGGLVIVGVVLLALALTSAIAFTLRVGRRSQPDREREARARDVFDQTGEWPSE
jgi:hypothetical protein